MLKKAESVIWSLENPQQGRSGEQEAAAASASTAEEQSEDVTPVFEAHVIAPGLRPMIDEEMLMSAIQNTWMDAEGAAG